MDFEKYFDLKAIKGKYQSAVAKETATALRTFCEQESEFQQAIEQSGKSYQQCLDSIMNGISGSVSDLDVYSKAVQFYFPGAKVHFRMEIDLIGDASPRPTTEAKPKSLSVSFDSLLDF